MKSKFLCLIIFSVLFMHTQLNASGRSIFIDSNFSELPINIEKAKPEMLLVRLNEIKDMDKSNMSSTEKKLLRKEVKTINQQLAKTSGGVYLSVGAILLIVLILILLL